MGLSRRAVLANAMVLGAAAASGPISAATKRSANKRVERWGVYEIALDGPQAGNPFDDVTLSATFIGGGRTIRVPGFYDGDGVYRIRFSPPEIGDWRWASESNAPALNGRTGAFAAIAPSPGNHGPVRVTKDGYHFECADGTPFRQIGTTSYSWALQSDARCAEKGVKPAVIIVAAVPDGGYRLRLAGLGDVRGRLVERRVEPEAMLRRLPRSPLVLAEQREHRRRVLAFEALFHVLRRHDRVVVFGDDQPRHRAHLAERAGAPRAQQAQRENESGIAKQ